mgnify:FL=1
MLVSSIIMISFIRKENDITKTMDPGFASRSSTDKIDLKPAGNVQK